MKASIRCKLCNSLFDIELINPMSRLIAQIEIQHARKKSSCEALMVDFNIERFEPCRCLVNEELIGSKGLTVEVHHGIYSVTGDHDSVDRWIQEQIRITKDTNTTFHLSIISGDKFTKQIRFERQVIVNED